jgi:hypothetical protein
LIQTKTNLTKFKKIVIKYDVVGFEPRNKFHYWNFSKFAKELELKSREVKLLLNSIEIYLKYEVNDCD